MKINLISNLDENSCIEKIENPNQVYAWFLRKAFTNIGVDARLIKDWNLKREDPPEADHTIVISAAAYTYMTTIAGYTEKLRQTTKGKLTCYFNTDDLRRGDQYFDYCFTQIKPRTSRPPKYVCAGWGADPEHCYPEQEEKAAFLDTKDFVYPRAVEAAYKGYDAVLPKSGLKIYNPVPFFNESKRYPWSEYMSIMRKCHFYLCTQLGEGGLTRLESATCGALLVVPVKLYRKRTMRLLNHRVWYDEEELIEILSKDVDIKANRQRALEHSWGDVVKRMIEILDS